MTRIDNRELSRVISHALRHEPWVYELELDDEGWAPLAQLLSALRAMEGFAVVQQSNIEEMIATSEKRRHEIKDDRIRAIYGHSIPGRLTRTPAPPPAVLYHGTDPASVDAIRAAGLRPMNRQNVHLSVDEATAMEVGRRKSKSPTLLRIRSQEASENGVMFYAGNDKVWLADEVPSRFIEF